MATDFGTIAHSGCFSSTCPRGSGWPKCAASSTFTQAWTCRPRARARASSRRERVELAGLPLEQRAARRERRAVEGVAPPAHLHEERVEARASAASSTTWSTACGETSAVRTTQSPRSSGGRRGGGRGGGRDGRASGEQRKAPRESARPHHATC